MEFLASIDRIEGDTAVLLPSGEARSRLGSGARLLWPVGLLPEGAGEGDLVRVWCRVDEVATSAARERVRGLHDRLASRPPGGREQ